MTNKLLRHPLQIVTVFVVVSFTWAMFSYGQTVEASQAMARFTARISLFIFALTFAASSLHKLFRSDFTTELLKNRRFFGIGFAYSHTVHLLAIALFFKLSGTQPPWLSVIFGGLAYLLMYAMAFTSNDASVKKLGAKNWKILHKIGIHYLWFIFFFSYLKRFLPSPANAPKPGGSKIEFVIAFIVVLTIMLVRITAAVTSKTGKQAAAVTE
jgi:DMSO/TMAO reductase YedYZ heme-binding membrane subunit